MMSQSTPLRSRKPYIHSPSSEDDTDSEEPLDEEGQETLLTTLQSEDIQKTTLYLRMFLGIILLSTLPSLYTFFFFSSPSQSASSGGRERVLAILCLSSLLCSGYILYFLPLDSSSDSGSGNTRRRLRFLEKSPLEKYLPVMNGILSGILVFAGWASSRNATSTNGQQQEQERGQGYESMIRFALPAIMFTMTILVRKQLAPVDFEDLQRARYELKGA